MKKLILCLSLILSASAHADDTLVGGSNADPNLPIKTSDAQVIQTGCNGDCPPTKAQSERGSDMLNKTAELLKTTPPGKSTEGVD